MRWTVAGDSPTCLAKRRALQWVAALGLRSVALITACSLAEVIRRGRPIRGLVRSPSSLPRSDSAAATDKPWSGLPQAALPDRGHSHPPRCPTPRALGSPAPE